MLRTDLERRLLDGRLAVRHLRDAWNAEMQQRLGVEPRDDTQGVLQDVHWADAAFGYFPLYMVGAAIAAQLAEGLRRDVPELDTQIAAGDFRGLTGWLRTAVHGQGARLSLQDLVREATGKPLAAAAALRHLERKYLGRESAA